MNDISPDVTVTPFPPDYRASGVLLHVASLPSPHGIGDLGPAALAWIDRLHEAGQTADMLTPEALGWLHDLTQTSARVLS
jgi:4-alpha-glucanotransferase